MSGFFAEFKHTLRRLRGQILGWGIGLALYGLLMGGMYDTIQRIEGLEEMLASYPKELMAFFGELGNLASPTGYFGTYFSSYIPVIVGIFSVTAAAGLLAGDEEKGTLDLIMAHPVSRTGLFWGRWAGYVVATFLILFIGYLGWAVTLPYTSMEVTALSLSQAFAPMLAILLLFGALALLLSMVLPSARLAAMAAGGLLVANFLLAGLAKINDRLELVMEVTPFSFLQGGDALIDLNWTWFIGLLVTGVILTGLAWVLFRRRDIRVGGERGWGWRRTRLAR